MARSCLPFVLALLVTAVLGAVNEKKESAKPEDSATNLDEIGPCHTRLTCRTINVIKATKWCDYHPRICKAIEKDNPNVWADGATTPGDSAINLDTANGAKHESLLNRGAKHESPAGKKGSGMADPELWKTLQDKVQAAVPEDSAVNLDSALEAKPSGKKASSMPRGSTVNLDAVRGALDSTLEAKPSMKKASTMPRGSAVNLDAVPKKSARRLSASEKKKKSMSQKSDDKLDVVGPCHEKLTCRTVKLIQDTNWCEFHPRICKAIELQ